GNKDINIPVRYKGDLPVRIGSRTETCIVREALDTIVPTWIIDNYHYFGRSSVYGHNDDTERFAFFSLAIYEIIRTFELCFDIIHLNDWHTAPISMLIRENEKSFPVLSDISIIYTIHNLEYQGISSCNIFNLFGIKEVTFKTDKVEYFGCFNAMKAGISYSDIITSVSKTSAIQMLTRKYGFGLEGILRARKNVLRGVVNGINTDIWNSEKDDAIYFKFDRDTLEYKKKNKEMLQNELGLEKCDKPVFCAISRLVPNKGLDLLEGAVSAIVNDGGQFVLLGSGDKFYENSFLMLQERYPGSVSVNLEFNTRKARRIYAGSDILLMPSRYEPCGLTQLIAMRYGTIPLVHKTGGLADTVIDETRNKGSGNGFSFSKYSLDNFISCIKKAHKYYQNKDEWTNLMKRAMDYDSSWDVSAKQYILLYNEAIEKNIERKRKGRKSVIEKKRKN
ncbi:MAG: glycogen synthase, partial [Clostridiaceae bacterium]|nr:glycogen synthase [Clostridiaceae bacterium]